jgi:predicted ATP-grasp superfamily ATP-dependent carboligase
MLPQTDKQIIIVGASVRAAAQSAARAGYAVWGADLFADADLCEVATARSVSRYPSGLLAALANSPDAPWMYTGALENYPALLRRMAKLRPCWGNSAEVVRRVRDPVYLSNVLRSHGVAFPPTFKAGTSPDCFSRQIEIAHSANDQTRWLLKPKRSGGGSKVKWLEPGQAYHLNGRYFIQQYLPGESCSAVYLAANGKSALLGMTRQLLGISWLGTQGFAYCGSVGPVKLLERERSELLLIGNVLAEQFGLVGLFGVDLVRRAIEPVESEQLAFAVIEVNPRYTASVEVLERSLNFSAIAGHANACHLGLLPTEELPASTPERTLAKGILFTRRAATFHPIVAEYIRQQNSEPLLPTIADLPHIGAPLASGSPVVTLFASGRDGAEAESALRRAASEFEAVLYGV